MVKELHQVESVQFLIVLADPEEMKLWISVYRQVGQAGNKAHFCLARPFAWP